MGEGQKALRMSYVREDGGRVEAERGGGTQLSAQLGGGSRVRWTVTVRRMHTWHTHESRTRVVEGYWH